MCYGIQISKREALLLKYELGVNNNNNNKKITKKKKNENENS